jgi:hypothetical protein
VQLRDLDVESVISCVWSSPLPPALLKHHPLATGGRGAVIGKQGAMKTCRKGRQQHHAG